MRSESRVPLNGSRVPRKLASLCSLSCEDKGEDNHLQIRKWGLTSPASTLIMVLPASRGKKEIFAV